MPADRPGTRGQGCQESQDHRWGDNQLDSADGCGWLRGVWHPLYV
jgi:hypothetical protein